MPNPVTLTPPRMRQPETVTPETEVVARAVEAALEPHQSDAYRLAVRRDRIRRHNGYWWVVVETDAPNVRANDLVDRLIGAEQDIAKITPRWVRLTSRLPEGVL